MCWQRAALSFLTRPATPSERWQEHSVRRPESLRMAAEPIFPLLKHVALRAEYRGLVYSAPDFGLSALNTNTVTHTAQPSAGLVIRF
jgi:hypothetical protein